jgi:hypothetical protein
LCTRWTAILDKPPPTSLPCHPGKPLQTVTDGKQIAHPDGQLFDKDHPKLRVVEPGQASCELMLSFGRVDHHSPGLALYVYFVQRKRGKRDGVLVTNISGGGSALCRRDHARNPVDVEAPGQNRRHLVLVTHRYW